MAAELDRQKSYDERSRAQKAFEIFDSDHNGFIDVEEFRKLVNFPELQSSQRSRLTEEQINAALRAIDKSGDGKISFEEFYQWWKQDLDKPPPLDRPATLTRAPSQLTAIRKNIKSQTFFENVARFGMQETYYCQLCCEYQVVDAAASVRLHCSHRYCRDCLTNYLKNAVDNGQVYPVCFTESNGKLCGEKMEEKEIADLLDEPTRAKFSKFRLNQGNSNNRQCPKCDFTQLGDPTNVEMTCDKCGQTYCFVHGGAHQNSTCAAYEKQHAAEDKKTAAAIAKNCKPCPKCNAPISKNGGCNHMKCATCGCSFCWLCNKEVEDTPLPSHYKPDPSNPTNTCVGRQMEGMPTLPLVGMNSFQRASFLIALFLVLAFMVLVVLPIAAVLTLVIVIGCCCCVLSYVNSGEDNRFAGAVGGIFQCVSLGLCVMISLFTCLPGVFMCMNACGCCPRNPEEGADDNWREDEEAAPRGDEEV